MSAIDTSLLAVMTPIESILVTSAYVKVPLILTLPVNVAATPVIKLRPLNDVAVTTPVTFIPALNVGAPVPAASEKLSARTLPPDFPVAGNVPVVPIPRMLGINSSPSLIIKSASPSTSI